MEVGVMVKQTYTSSDNVIVAGGNLKITAKKVGSGYTSSRLKSEGKYKFTYGKVGKRKLTPAGTHQRFGC
jgi:beta-glucanase (GH16 family)